MIRDLLTGTKRFTDLMDRLGGITPKTLSQRLRELEDAGIVAVDREPGRREVWYRLTRAGADLRPVLDALSRWGLQHAWRGPAPASRCTPSTCSAPLCRPSTSPPATTAGPLALAARRRGLPGRERRPPVVAYRGAPARARRRHDHRDRPGPDRPHLHRVRRRHRHHRRSRASPAVPAADRHHGHRRAARLTGGSEIRPSPRARRVHPCRIEPLAPPPG